MATFYPVGGGAPGIDPSTLTTNADDILYPKIGGVYGNYNGVQGTLQLTGNAKLNHVLSGETFYTTNAKSKLTGTMTVQSILSFSCAPYSASQIIFTWQNPYAGPFSGVIIVGKTGGYPANINDGTRYYKGFGNNTNAGGTSNVTIDGFSVGITYYFKAFSYATVNGEEWLGSTERIANTIINVITQIFTSSTTWNVPSGVNTINVFCVGGGAGGAGNLSVAHGYGGGGGGYTTTTNVNVTSGQSILITIGSGGNNNSNGGTTSFGSLASANGGLCSGGYDGGNGGSGGGGGAEWYYDDSNVAQRTGGDGGTNGGDSGIQPASGRGIGQHTTTRPFGESTGTIYSGGGAGGSAGAGGGASYVIGAPGGEYGGGQGGDHDPDISWLSANGRPGTANSGGGGGGSGTYTSESGNNSGGRGGVGGSGICIIRYIG